MLAYPAYTVELIETGLSWRQVKGFMECWEKNPPVSIRMARVENMLAQKFGFKKSQKIKTSDDLLRSFDEIGWSG